MKKSIGVYVERFSVDFIGKTISGTKASFDKASKGSGPIYEELARKVANHPNFRLIVILPEKPQKKKETYKGMSLDFMRNYLEMKNDAYAEEFEKTIIYAKENEEKVYPYVKKRFFEHFTDSNGNLTFDYAVEKDAVKKYLTHKIELKQTTTEAAKVTASTTENKPDLTPAEKAA